MSDDALSPELEPVVPATPAPEADDAADEQDVLLNPGEEAEAEADATDEPDIAADFDDFEWDGKQFKAPKTLKDSLERLQNMDADYTRKSQANADVKRELEQRQQALEQQAQATEQELDARAELRSTDQQIRQYQAVNWQQLEQEDPLAAQSHWRNYQMLKDRHADLSRGLEQTQQQRLQLAQQETAKRIEATREFAAKNIKGWTEEIDAKVTDFATSELGFTPDQVVAAVNPAVYRALYLAWLGNQSLQKQQAQPKPTNANVQPLKTVSGKTNPAARKSLAEMSMEEYAAARKAGRG